MRETRGLKGDTEKGIRNRTEVKQIRVKRAEHSKERDIAIRKVKGIMYKKGD